jgi:AcrR family transcriptional regulator
MSTVTAKRRIGGAERRELLLGAARDQFSRHGFHGAATAAIARQAGCSEAILYRHFASKRDLLLAVLEREVGERIAQGRALAPPAGADPPVALPEVLRQRLEDPEMTVTARLILLAIALTDDPEVGEAMRGWFAAVRAPLRAAIAAGQEAGAVRGDVDAEALTWLWHGLVLVAAVRNAIAPDGEALAAIDAARVLAEVLRPAGTAQQRRGTAPRRSR